MAVDQSVAYEVIALHLQHRADRIDAADFVEMIEQVVADVETEQDVFELVLHLGSVAAGAIAAVAATTGRTPEQILQDAALLAAGDDED